MKYPKIKQKEFTLATIRIKEVYDDVETAKGCSEKKNVFWTLTIDEGLFKTGMRVDSKRELLQSLKEHLCMPKR